MDSPTLLGMIQIGVTSLRNGSFLFLKQLHWISGLQNRSNHEEFRLESNSEFYHNEYDTSIPGFIPALGPIPRYISKPKPRLKWHFCNLNFNTEEERKDHDEFWHRDKLLTVESITTWINVRMEISSRIVFVMPS